MKPNPMVGSTPPTSPQSPGGARKRRPLPALPPRAGVAAHKNAAAPVQTVRALYDYTAQHHDEMSFSAGAVITITAAQDHVESNNKDWLHGSLLNGSVAGVFPATYVKLVTPDSTSKRAPVTLANEPADLTEAAPAQTGRTLFAYAGQNHDELSFAAGCIVSVSAVQSHGQGPDWLHGTLIAGGEEGIFPTSYVEILPAAASGGGGDGGGVMVIT